MPESFKRSYRAWMDAEWWRMDMPVAAGGQGAPRMLWWALVELIQGAQAPVFMFGGGPSFAGLLHTIGTAGAAADRGDHDRSAVGGVDGADRAGRRVGRRRRAHGGASAGRRVVAHRGREAVHHLWRARPGGEHRALRARPAGGGRAGHEGAVDVRGAEVSLRPRDRRAQGAQRGLRDQRREEDGHQGFDHLRADAWRARGRRWAGWWARCTTESRRCSR